ncbi:unnamed protein product [Phytomonas sp. EM1]|nr:unnamed protein product [Phytomonas sp. EM1]|eukprot:CCW61202.1 unnamed protein product [Phytomonas sp. isolate EM1]
MQYTIRYSVLLLSFVAFVFALLGTIPLPYFVRKLSKTYSQSGEIIVTLWSMHTTKIELDNGGTSVIASPTPEIRNHRLRCKEERDRFMTLQSFAIMGVVFGLYAFLMSCLQCFFYLKVKLPLLLLLALSFLSEFILIIVGISIYQNTGCKGKSNSFASFKDADYAFGTSFIMHILCCFTYIICLLLTPFTQDLWCGKR